MRTIVITAPSPDLQLTGDVWIDHLRWYGATAAGHRVQILDAGGSLFWASQAAATPAPPDDVELHRTADGGFSVPVLDSGTLLIYVGHETRNW